MKLPLYAILSILTLSLYGCVKEDVLLRKTVEEGIPTTFEIGYTVAQSRVFTRAALDDSYENRVENIYILVFDASGNRIEIEGNSFFTQNTGLTVNNEVLPVKGSVSVSAKTANDARIVGVANLRTAAISTAYDIDAAVLDAVKTLDELQNLVLNASKTVERGASFLMTGFAYDNATQSEKIDIVGSAGGNTKLDCTLKLSRVDSKVEVRVTSEKSNQSWSNFSFEPKTWQVINVPLKSLLLPYSIDEFDGPWEDAGGSDWDFSRTLSEEIPENYFNTEALPFEEVEQTEIDNTKYYTGGSFVFYMPENRKRFKQQITEADPAKAYALRDDCNISPVDGNTQGKPGQEYENTDFKYADDYSTYLVLTGHLSYIDALDYNVNADLRFIVHLGYVSGNADDYDTKRNGHYIYNIKVTGVNNIRVEVTNAGEGDPEVRPGYEGDVVYSNNKIYNLDSHFDRCLLEIPPDDVTDYLTWGVKTQFSSGIHTAGSSSFDGVEDYKWIQFAINKKHGVGHGVYVKYPGEQCYDPDIQTLDGSGLMDIDQLIRYLKQVKAADPAMTKVVPDGSDHVCITAFVDENVYVSNPVDGKEDLTLWKTSADKDDRQMHIIVPFEDGSGTGKDVVYSPDGNSSMVNSLYTFSQRSVRTVFNVNNPYLKTAWGLESVMEAEEGDSYGGRLPVGDVSLGSDTRNGRANTIKWAVGKNWSSIVDTSKRYSLKSPYQTAAYACMLRNRDLNGDDIVQDREVRWYLAAIDQLTDIYLGEFALDEASRLYPRNKVDRPGGNDVYWHYTSSSYNASDNDGRGAPWVFWAEEGASRGSYNQNSKDGSYQKNGSRYAYRCIRNLGVAIDDVQTNPEDLIKVEDHGDGTYTLDMSNMNVKALRSNRETTVLPLHDETSEVNKPYVKFRVTKDAYVNGKVTPYDYGDGTSTSNIEIAEPINGGRTAWGSSVDETGIDWINRHEWAYYQTYDPCPSGYRIPNQRELLIMTTRLSSEQWPEYSVVAAYYEGVLGGTRHTINIAGHPPLYISQTAFSMDGQSPYSDTRDGFIWYYENNTFSLVNDNRDEERGYVRCVRDED